MQRFEQVSEFKERLVAVNRVSKTVKGGRNMRFSARQGRPQHAVQRAGGRRR